MHVQHHAAPISWTPHFLVEKNPRETHKFIKTNAVGWEASDVGQLAAAPAMPFARALLMQKAMTDKPFDGNADDISIVALAEEHMLPVAPSGQLCDWASRRLMPMVQP